MTVCTISARGRKWIFITAVYLIPAGHCPSKKNKNKKVVQVKFSLTMNIEGVKVNNVHYVAHMLPTLQITGERAL